MIKGQISKFFNIVNLETLISLLCKRIKDEKFLKLIQSGLKSRLILPDGLVSSPYMGIPEGGVVSPVLSNIYLDPLDRYIKEYQKDFNKGVKRANYSIYDRTLKKMGMSEVIKQGLSKKDSQDPNFRRLHYIRYANDFLFGIIGSKEESVKIKEGLLKFLADGLNLFLHPKKTPILNSKEYVKILGYSIGFKKVNYKFKVKGTYRSACRKILTLFVDIKKVIKKLAEAQFCKLNGDPLPCLQYLHQTQSVSLTKVNTILRRFVNYYKLCNNFRRSLNRIRYILQHSLAKMFAAKFKLKTRATVFKMAGPTFAKKLGSIKGKKVMGATDSQLEKNEKGVI